MLEEDRVLAGQAHLTPRHSIQLPPALALPPIGSNHMSAATLPGVEPPRPAVQLSMENSELDNRMKRINKMEVCCCLFIIIFLKIKKKCTLGSNDLEG